MPKKYLIVGAGLSGAVLADRLTATSDCVIDVWDKRSHVAGNCYTEKDEKTGIMVHCFGPHIFNTNKLWIWEYINQFWEFRPYVHRVKAIAHKEVYSFPINLHTINQFFGGSFSPESGKEFMHKVQRKYPFIDNFEKQVCSMVGGGMYDVFFRGCTKKQWGCDPSELPASVGARIPVRFNYDDNFHNSIYTGIPVDGYTAVINRMLKNKNISVTLGKEFSIHADVSEYDHVFYTGAIDQYFGYNFGRLGYRTVTFEKHYATGDYQGAAQINYCDESVPYTRITEHKHFTPWQQFDDTVYFKEFSKETSENDTPFYPKNLAADKEMYQKYKSQAMKCDKISFLGRLATYRYLDMQHVIEEAHEMADNFLKTIK